ncbi:MAG: sigma-54-dependent Fis family transcriptional regulator [Desulfatirhabdiaceae bacterium]|nr:sigma-54-dependent Fis family transcriptional regulator [Desulfatirhabdiaceae bacterium]
MYELVWKDSGYRIVRRKPVSAEPTAGFLSSETFPVQGRPVDHAIWKQFVKTGATDRAAVTLPIQKSWLRCRQMGVDPAFGKCGDIRSEAEFSADHLRLRGLAQETKRRLYDLVRGRSLVVTISDRQGILVTMFGDHRILAAADKLHFGPGANWSEKSVGTNAIGTSLAEGRHLQVAGYEHFCQGHHAWVCTAAPVFGIKGEVIGCVDVSGPRTADHSRAMSLVIIGACAIERELFQQQALEFEHHAKGVVDAMMLGEMTPLVFLDARGIIVSVNPAAAALLGRQADQLTGTNADNLFELPRDFSRMAPTSRRCLKKGLSLTLRSNPECPVRAFPIASPNGVFSGLLLAVHEARHSRVSIPDSATRMPDPFRRILGRSHILEKVVTAARQVARTPIAVLLTGESGTGKEILARAIHGASSRCNGPFVAVNCGAIPPELIQSELFGHEEGAFTGARRGGASGKFEQASGGTLFLDEIAEMPLPLQVNLLRVLEDGNVTRVGGCRTIPVDVRVVAATNNNIDGQVNSGKFRRDLYYRINVVRIDVPPLRHRGEDVVLLARHFIDESALSLDRTVRCVETEFYDALRRHDWPGNVRELRHAVESAIALMPEDLLRREYLPDSIRKNIPDPESVMPETEPFNLEALEKETIQKAIYRFDGNISHMARVLGIGRNTLYAKLKKYRLLNPLSGA